MVFTVTRCTLSIWCLYDASRSGHSQHGADAIVLACAAHVYVLYSTGVFPRVLERVCRLCVSLFVRERWCILMSRRRGEMSASPFPSPNGARQRNDCFFSRVTNARTSIGFAGGRGILAVVRHLAHGLIEVIHTHPPALAVSNKPG